VIVEQISEGLFRAAWILNDIHSFAYNFTAVVRTNFNVSTINEAWLHISMSRMIEEIIWCNCCILFSFQNGKGDMKKKSHFAQDINFLVAEDNILAFLLFLTDY
jgi:hypothetical protein